MTAPTDYRPRHLQQAALSHCVWCQLDQQVAQPQTPTLDALSEAQKYLDTAEESKARMRMDLHCFMARHGEEVAGEVYAEAYRAWLHEKAERDHEHDEVEPEGEWAR